MSVRSITRLKEVNLFENGSRADPVRAVECHLMCVCVREVQIERERRALGVRVVQAEAMRSEDPGLSSALASVDGFAHT